MVVVVVKSGVSVGTLGRFERRKAQRDQTLIARPRRVFPGQGKSSREALMRQLRGVGDEGRVGLRVKKQTLKIQRRDGQAEAEACC